MSFVSAWKQAGANYARQLPPFPQRLLCGDRGQQPREPQRLENSLVALLPACRRSSNDNLEPFPVIGLQQDPTASGGYDDVVRCQSWIDEEINIQRLGGIQEWLWIVGRPRPPRPLHQQLLMNRNIVVTEKMDLHLVWTTERIFIKPLPRFMLEPLFWQKFICCQKGGACYSTSCDLGARRSCGLGFLFTYAALIMY